MAIPDFSHNLHTSFFEDAKLAHAKAMAPKPQGDSDQRLSFNDFVDIVNPLQHIPVISTLYRKFAGDPIKPLPKMAGDALYGGVSGLASSVADYAFEKLTGKNFGDTVLALITGDDSTPSPASPRQAVASNTPAPTAPKSIAASFATSVGAPAAAVTSAPTPVPVLPQTVPGAQIPTLSQASLDALIASLNHDGVDADLSERALNAYRYTSAAPSTPSATAAPQQLH